jgi:hypothetical protein
VAPKVASAPRGFGTHRVRATVFNPCRKPPQNLSQIKKQLRLTCPPFFGFFYNLFVIVELHFLSCGICCTKVDKLRAPGLYGLHDEVLENY